MTAALCIRPTTACGDDRVPSRLILARSLALTLALVLVGGGVFRGCSFVIRDRRRARGACVAAGLGRGAHLKRRGRADRSLSRPARVAPLVRPKRRHRRSVSLGLHAPARHHSARRICVTLARQPRLSRRLEARRATEINASVREGTQGAVGDLSGQCARLAVAPRRAEDQMVYLRGTELASMYTTCPPQTVSASATAR